ncbi:MAG: hypothetical protein LBH32_10505 [Dysgonamonadaceae bacterium]|jgi:hypothetical protein|nr:hypothetical protein [Dysgonamonadaceae bacterium]
MNLEHYIKGIRKGNDINALEREAMLDLFLADALEGYDQTKENHQERIEEMLKHVAMQTRPKGRPLRNWSIVALAVVLLATCAYFLWDDFSSFIKEITTANRNEKITKSISHVIEEKKSVLPAKNDSVISDSTVIAPLFKVHGIFENKFEPLLPFIKPDVIAKNGVQSSKKDSLIVDTKALSAKNKEEIKSKEENKNKEEVKSVDSDTEDKSNSPRPAVGNREYEKYLKSKLVRPVEEECSNVSGKVVLKFFVNGNGRPYNIDVIQSLCPAADAEAIRLVKEGPGWTAGEEEVKVEVKF